MSIKVRITRVLAERVVAGNFNVFIESNWC